MIFRNVITEQHCHYRNTNMCFRNDCCGNDRVMFFHWYMGQIHHVMAGIAVYSKQLYTIYALKVDWNKYTYFFSTFGNDVEFMYGQYLLTFIEYILIFFTSAASSSLASVFLVYYVILIDLHLTMMCTLLYHFFQWVSVMTKNSGIVYFFNFSKQTYYINSFY